MRLNVTAVSVRDAKPSYAFGESARLPLTSGHQRALVRAAIPSDVPDDAVVAQADLVFYVADATSGSQTVTARRLDAGFAVSKVTWNRQPGVTGTGIDEAVGAVAAGYEVRISVLDDVQGFVSGSLTNRGWRISTDSASGISLVGSSADVNAPWLDLEYTVPGGAPVDLTPDGGAVSIAKPTLLATVPDGTTAIQVQIDPDADEVSPAWDSGTVAATAGVLPLASTTYPGLALAATTSWRMRAFGPLGWGPYSEWATFSRVAKPTVTITAPAATTGDPTPPATWTAPGQTAWQVLTYNATTGALLSSSGVEAGDDTEWTPSKGVKRVGDSTRVVVRVWDDVDRVETPGDPVYASATATTTLVTASSSPGVTSLSATSGATPFVRLAWTGATVDFWQIMRDGKFYDRIDGSRRSYIDEAAKPRRRYSYRVLPVGDSGVGALGPTATVTPNPIGLWLFDGDEFLFMVDYQVDPSWADQAIAHDVIDGAPVRRRVGAPPPRGTVSGFLVDGALGGAGVMARTGEAFKASAQSRVYRLAWGDKNVPVTIGDLLVETVDEDPSTYEVSFAWWQTNDELPWDEDD